MYSTLNFILKIFNFLLLEIRNLPHFQRNYDYVILIYILVT